MLILCLKCAVFLQAESHGSLKACPNGIPREMKGHCDDVTSILLWLYMIPVVPMFILMIRWWLSYQELPDNISIDPTVTEVSKKKANLCEHVHDD